MGKASFDFPVQNPRVPVFFLLRSLQGLNYSTEVELRWAWKRCLHHGTCTASDQPPQSNGVGRAGEERGETQICCPTKASWYHPRISEQERKGNVGNYVTYCKSWDECQCSRNRNQTSLEVCSMVELSPGTLGEVLGMECSHSTTY